MARRRARSTAGTNMALAVAREVTSRALCCDSPLLPTAYSDSSIFVSYTQLHTAGHRSLLRAPQPPARCASPVPHTAHADVLSPYLPAATQLAASPVPHMFQIGFVESRAKLVRWLREAHQAGHLRGTVAGKLFEG